MSSPWDGVVLTYQRDIAERKESVLDARRQLDELQVMYSRRTEELATFIDREVDVIAVHQSVLDHALRQRDGDPLVEAVEGPDPDLADTYREGE